MTDDQLEKALEVALDEILEEFPDAEEVAVVLIDDRLASSESVEPNGDVVKRFTVALYENLYGAPRIIVSLPALRKAAARSNILECCRVVLRHEFGHAAGLTHDHPKMPAVLSV